MRDRYAAQAALAWPHTAAAEELGLIGTLASEAGHFAHPASGDFLAATHDRVVGGHENVGRRLVERIQERADALLVLQGARKWGGLAFQCVCIKPTQGMSGSQSGQRATGLCGQGACNGDAVAGHAQTRQRGLAIRIGDHMPGVLRRVPAVLETHEARQLRVGHHAVMQQHGIGGDFMRAALRGEPQPVCPVVAQHDQPAARAEATHAHAPQALRKAQTLEQCSPCGAVAEHGWQVLERGEPMCRCAGFDHRLHVGAGLGQLAGHQQQQWACAGQHDRTLRDAVGMLERNLRGPRVHDPRQGPARDGRGPLKRPGGRNQLRGTQLQGTAVAQRGYGEIAVYIPHQRLMHHLHCAGLQCRDGLSTLHVVGAQQGGNACIGAAHIAPDLAACMGLFVEQRGAQTQARCGGGCGHACRPCADDDHLMSAGRRRSFTQISGLMLTGVLL